MPSITSVCVNDYRLFLILSVLPGAIHAKALTPFVVDKLVRGGFTVQAVGTGQIDALALEQVKNPVTGRVFAQRANKGRFVAQLTKADSLIEGVSAGIMFVLLRRL